MKKISTLFLTIISLFLNSCGSDDSSENLSVPNNQTWRFYEISNTVYSESDLDGITLYNYEENYNECEDVNKHDYYQFNSNGISVHGWYESGMNCNLLTSPGTWSQSGNIITINEDYGGGESATYYCDILEQSTTVLKVKVTEVYHLDGDDYTSYRIIVFHKQ